VDVGFAESTLATEAVKIGINVFLTLFRPDLINAIAKGGLILV
jgi:hypothetical protein